MQTETSQLAYSHTYQQKAKVKCTHYCYYLSGTISSRLFTKALVQDKAALASETGLTCSQQSSAAARHAGARCLQHWGWQSPGSRVPLSREHHQAVSKRGALWLKGTHHCSPRTEHRSSLYRHLSLHDKCSDWGINNSHAELSELNCSPRTVSFSFQVSPDTLLPAEVRHVQHWR